MRDVNYYLKRGFDQRTAEYFVGGRRRIKKAVPADDFTVILTFDNGEIRRLDMKPAIKEGTVFAFLADPTNFRRLYLDESRCVSWDIDPTVDSRKVWNNKVDLCPDSCYLDSVPVGGGTYA